MVTGKDLVKWIEENDAGDCQVTMIEDGYMVFKAHPEMHENAELKAKYGNANWMKKEGRSIVIG